MEGKNTEVIIDGNKHKYQTLVEATDEMINTVSVEGKILWVNSAWKKNLLYDDADLKNLKITDVFSTATKEGHPERMQKLLAGEKITDFSATLLDKNAQTVHVKGTIVPVFENGKYVGTQGFFRNVTEIKKIQEERIKAETRLQNTLDKMSVGCHIISFDWTHLYINNAAAEQIFRKAEDVTGEKVTDFNPRFSMTNVYRMWKRCMEDRIYHEYEESYTFSNGVTKWFDFKIEPIEEGIFVMTTDITDKKEAAESIRKSQKLLAESQRIAKLGSWELDIVNDVFYWSEEVYRMFEIDQHRFDASYGIFLDKVHPEDRDQVRKAYEDSVTNKTPFDIVHRVKFPDNRIKYMHEQGETFYNSDGKPVRSIGTVLDITQQKEAEILLQKNEYKYQQLVENISDGLLIADTEGRVLYANQRLLDLYRLTNNDIENLYVRGFFNKRVPAKIRRAAQA